MLLKLTTNSREKYERRFQHALHVAIGLVGRLIPDTEAVVIATRLNDESTLEELPEALRDPLAILDRDQRNSPSGQGLIAIEPNPECLDQIASKLV